MRISYWPPALQARLKEKYSYDPATGEVTRREHTKFGPKVYGAIGSVNSGHLVTQVLWGDRMWIVRLTKLAVFLRTGEQYTRILYKDGDKLNLKWDNLLYVGQPLTENFIEDRKQLMEMAALEFKRKKNEHKIQMLGLKKEEKERDGMEQYKWEWRQANPDYPGTFDEYWDNKEKQDREEAEKVNRPRNEVMKKCHQEWFARYKLARYKRGVITKMSREQAFIFMGEALTSVARVTKEGVETTPTPSEYVDRVKAMGEWDMVKSQLAKWERDLVTICAFQMGIEAGTQEEANFKVWLLTYTFEGKAVNGDYDLFDEETQAAYTVDLQGRLAQLEKELAGPAAIEELKTPLAIDTTENIPVSPEGQVAGLAMQPSVDAGQAPYVDPLDEIIRQTAKEMGDL